MAYYGSGPIKELVIQAQKKRKKKKMIIFAPEGFTF